MTINTVALQQGFDVGALYAGNYIKADDLNGQTFSAVITVNAGTKGASVAE